MSEREPVCFVCGSSVETAFQNVLADGRPCTTCRRRAMEALPALLPGTGHGLREEEDVELSGEEASTAGVGTEGAGQANGPAAKGGASSFHLVSGSGEGPDDGPVPA